MSNNWRCPKHPMDTYANYDGAGTPISQSCTHIGCGWHSLSTHTTDPGVKFDTGKLRFDLIPVYPLEAVAEVFTIGAAKYGDRNWEKGLTWGRVFSAMMRHAWKWWRGETHDPEDGQHHLASVVWCAMVLMDFQRLKAGTDDRSPLYVHTSTAQTKSVFNTEQPKPAIPPVAVAWGSENDLIDLVS